MWLLGKIPQTGIWGLGSARSRHQHGHVSMRVIFWVADFLNPYMVEGAKELCWISVIRALIPFTLYPQLYPLDLITSPNIITFRG